jgi:hypothetical protein
MIKLEGGRDFPKNSAPDPDDLPMTLADPSSVGLRIYKLLILVNFGFKSRIFKWLQRRTRATS